MDLSFKINVPFWTTLNPEESQTRLNNIRFLTSNLTDLTNYLRSRGVNISYEIFDFSIESIATVPVTHIPFGKKGEFRKSEKLNILIERTVEDIYIGWDADIVVKHSDFENFYQTLLEHNIAGYYNSFNAKSIDTPQSHIDYVNFSTDNLESLPGHMYHDITLCLGGLFLIPTQYLKLAGGYNEKITHRGDEDGELHDRFQREYGIYRKPVTHFYSYHLPHIYDFSNSLYQKHPN